MIHHTNHAHSTLLVGSGLLLRSLTGLRRVNPGFEAQDLMTAQLVLSPVRYDNPEKLRAFYLAALDRLSAMPGVQAAAATVALPFAHGTFTASFAIVGHLVFARPAMALWRL